MRNRRAEVRELLAQGRPAQDIADELGVSLATVYRARRDVNGGTPPSPAATPNTSAASSLVARQLGEFDHEISVARAHEIALADELEAARRATRQLVAVRDALRGAIAG